MAPVFEKEYTCYFLLNVVSVGFLNPTRAILYTVLLFSFECCPATDISWVQTPHFNFYLAIFFWMLWGWKLPWWMSIPDDLTCYFLLNVVCWKNWNRRSRRWGTACYFLLNVVAVSSTLTAKMHDWLILLFSFECCFQQPISGAPAQVCNIHLLFSFECCITDIDIPATPRRESYLAIFFWMLFALLGFSSRAFSIRASLLFSFECCSTWKTLRH